MKLGFFLAVSFLACPSFLIAGPVDESFRIVCHSTSEGLDTVIDADERLTITRRPTFKSHGCGVNTHDSKVRQHDRIEGLTYKKPQDGRTHDKGDCETFIDQMVVGATTCDRKII